MHEDAVEQNENAGNEWANQALKHTKCSVVTDMFKEFHWNKATK